MAKKIHNIVAGGFVVVGDEQADKMVGTGFWGFEGPEAHTADNGWNVAPTGEDTGDSVSDAPALPQAQEEAPERPDVPTVRAWAKDNDIPVSDKGRVAETVYEQYAEAHKD
jgi:hypothetical protein